LFKLQLKMSGVFFLRHTVDGSHKWYYNEKWGFIVAGDAEVDETIKY